MHAYGELDDVLGLTLTVGDELVDPCTGKNGKHAMKGLLRQSSFGRLGGKIDAPLKDAEQRAKKIKIEVMPCRFTINQLKN